MKLAVDAYPDLECLARLLAWFYIGFIALGIALVITATAVNLNVASYSDTVNRISTARANFASLLTPESMPSLATNCETSFKNLDQRSASAAVTCFKASQALRDITAAQKALHFQLHPLLDPSEFIHIGSPDLVAWLVGQGPPPLITRSVANSAQDSPVAMAMTNGIGPTREELATAAAVNGINAVGLPALLGLLGAITGALRSHRNKIRDSTLAPRHVNSLLLGVVLGMAAGLAIGYVFNVGEVAGANAGGGTPVIGNLHLTSPALAFLGGFGSDSFFRFVDGLLDRLFRPQPAPPKSPPKRRP